MNKAAVQACAVCTNVRADADALGGLVAVLGPLGE